jgi:hypothetical protein
MPAPGREIHDLPVGDERFHIIFDGDTALPRSGPAPVPPDVTVACDLPTLIALDAGAITPAKARRAGATIEGPRESVQRLFTIFNRGI